MYSPKIPYMKSATIRSACVCVFSSVNGCKHSFAILGIFCSFVETNGNVSGVRTVLVRLVESLYGCVGEWTEIRYESPAKRSERETKHASAAFACAYWWWWHSIRCQHTCITKYNCSRIAMPERMNGSYRRMRMRMQTMWMWIIHPPEAYNFVAYPMRPSDKRRRPYGRIIHIQHAAERLRIYVPTIGWSEGILGM